MQTKSVLKKSRISLIFNTREKSGKSQSVTEWCRCGECGVMDTNVEWLSCAAKMKP